MKCLRRMLGVTRRDRLRNEDIRKKVGTTSVLNFIKKQQIKWFGHTSRLPTDIAHQLLFRYNGCKTNDSTSKWWIPEITSHERHHVHKSLV
uniref:Uncharacterized protein n=2 Tax=Arion vulgaris TaxID=1028688 RepID=A0A0B7BTJ8_9EUPU